jgi:hypothetical protein
MTTDTINKIRQKIEHRTGRNHLRFYLSGKITGLTYDEYTLNFAKSRMALIMTHYLYNSDEVINPLHLVPFFGLKTWLCYMITDIYNLLKCDAVVFQSNWTESKGAKVEMWFAILTNKLIILQ